ncbi:MAG TPA: PP2C family protein-serine/threonine phosphatase [Candidatus Eisenbacteria bacterium]|nr:PP2C family protein-serine/threonine phosphatase [Candidatus Eisenbacteria bacterium]
MIADAHAVAMFREQVPSLIIGTSFVILGLVALAVATIRRRAGGVRAVFWLGIWVAVFGIQRLINSDSFVAVLPRWQQACVPYMHAFATYFMLVLASLTFRELTLGWVRRVLTMVASMGLLIAVVGIGIFVRTGEEYRLATYDQILASATLALFLPVIVVPSLGQKYVVLQNRGLLLFGSLVFAVEALYVNVVRPFGLRIDSVWDDLAFATYIFSLGYVAMQRVYASERRLSSIENELAIARQLQFSILPTTTPEVRNLRIAAVYEPMTAVAGDFYEYLAADECRAGFLVADVSGHGVPAALIAAMIKVAAQSVTALVSDPAELLRRLREILSKQLQGQFVSAAYLWIDVEGRSARYSAAGHPPLLYWRAADNTLARVESNGLLFGVPFESAYPVREIPFASGDRFLLYTDGLSEPENAQGEPFGDRKLEQILHDNAARPAAELSLLLLDEVRAWQSASVTQQDDITLVTIDVV